MAASEGMSKLSDDLRKLSARAKEAEDHAAAARAKAKADIEADRDDARAVGEQQAQALREKVDEGHEQISDRWADVQRSWDERVAAIRADIESRKAEHDLHKAEHRADRAEDEAEYAIAFAYSAIVEAEYAVLDAAWARMEADDLSKERTGRLRAAPLPPGAEGPPGVLRPTLTRVYVALSAAAREILVAYESQPGPRECGYWTGGIATPRSPVRTRSPPSESRRPRAGWCVARRCSSGYRRPRPTVWFWSALPRAAARRCWCARGSRTAGLSEHTAWVAVEQRERDAQHFWLVGGQRARGGCRPVPSRGSVRRPGFAARPWSRGCWRTFVRLKSRSCW